MVQLTFNRVFERDTKSFFCDACLENHNLTKNYGFGITFATQKICFSITR